MQYQKYQKTQYIDIWEIILYLRAIPYRLKTKNGNNLIFICTIIKYLMLNIFLFYRLCFFFKKEKKRAGCILMFFSKELLFKIKITLIKYHNMILMLKAKPMFLKCFYYNTI